MQKILSVNFERWQVTDRSLPLLLQQHNKISRLFMQQPPQRIAYRVEQMKTTKKWWLSVSAVSFMQAYINTHRKHVV